MSSEWIDMEYLIVSSLYLAHKRRVRKQGEKLFRTFFKLPGY